MRALITGITGQDGSYLAEFLLEKGYEVFGLVRRTSCGFHLDRIAHLEDRITLLTGDMLDCRSLIAALDYSKPDEIYNLAALSFVPTSFSQPGLTASINALGAGRLLDAIRVMCPKAKFYQASSSEMFGSSPAPQNERTPFHPRSPYGASKVYAHHLTVNYRESYGLFAVSGILFNHESPRRGLEFVTRKITDGVARIKLGLAKELKLGNLDAERDWGWAPDYVEAMWMMLQQKKPRDFVIATGYQTTVQDFARIAFSTVGLEWDEFVEIDKSLIRPTEVDELRGDATDARLHLGWEPKTPIGVIIQRMVKADIERLSK